MSLDYIYRGEPPPRRFNMARYCLGAAAAPPGKPALLVVHDAAGADIETWSYEALEAAILRTAYAFRSAHGLKAGARVAIRLRNRTPYALAFFGAIAGGLVPIPVSPDLTGRELAFVLADSEAVGIVLDDSLPHGAFEPDFAIIPEAALVRAAESGPAQTQRFEKDRHGVVQLAAKSGPEPWRSPGWAEPHALGNRNIAPQAAWTFAVKISPRITW
jgi:acyl-CoA synthetase (AMP-forming)/AMP-acid ligase II